MTYKRCYAVYGPRFTGGPSPELCADLTCYARGFDSEREALLWAEKHVNGVHEVHSCYLPEDSGLVILREALFP